MALAAVPGSQRRLRPMLKLHFDRNILSGRDFHIRLERDNYVIDVFDAGFADADEAHLTSHECDTWEQVLRYCRECDGVTVV